MTPIKILWVDDEIELLKPHFLFLKGKGYHTTACNNGQDALLTLQDKTFDVVLLDENMPGLGGLETLNEIKLQSPNLPVIMITKNEEEQIMEEAIGAKISFNQRGEFLNAVSGDAILEIAVGSPTC